MTTRGAKAAALIGTVLLVLPLVIPPVRGSEPVRTIDVRLARYAFSPERIELRRGERVRLNVTSADGAHGFQVKALGIKVRVPEDGKAVTVDVTPNEAGTFPVKCSEYCGTGHRRMTATLIVTPGT